MRIALGTAQFGLDYGISNEAGQTLDADVKAILSSAQRAGVRLIDTASAYGNAEAKLGTCWPADHVFNIVSKTPKLADDASARDTLRDAFATTLSQLHARAIYGLLAHEADDLLGPQGSELWDGLCALKKAGLVEKIGASAYSGEQIEALTARFPLDIVQIPLNIFDQRLVSGGHLALMKEAGIEIHARSIFLQGLLLMQPEAVPADMPTAKAHLVKLRNRLSRYGVTALEASLGFSLQQEEIDRVIIGVTSVDELFQVLAAAAQPLPDDFPWADCAAGDLDVIDPRRWPVAETPDDTEDDADQAVAGNGQAA